MPRPRMATAVLIGLLAALANPAAGAPHAVAAREAAEYVLRTFGPEAAEETVETLAKRIQRLAAQHGDEAIDAVRRVGPRALALADDAGENAPQALRLMARYGDDGARLASRPAALRLVAAHGDEAAEVMIRHAGAAEPVIEEFGTRGARALGKVTTGQQARRVAMLADDEALHATGRTGELLDVIGRHGDRAAEFIWRHKGALAVSAALAAFLADPEPFLDGTRDLAELAGQAVAAPLTELAAGPRNANWTVVLSILVLGLLTVFAFRALLRRA